MSKPAYTHVDSYGEQHRLPKQNLERFGQYVLHLFGKGDFGLERSVVTFISRHFSDVLGFSNRKYRHIRFGNSEDNCDKTESRLREGEFQLYYDISRTYKNRQHPKKPAPGRAPNFDPTRDNRSKGWTCKRCNSEEHHCPAPRFCVPYVTDNAAGCDGMTVKRRDRLYKCQRTRYLSVGQLRNSR